MNRLLHTVCTGMLLILALLVRAAIADPVYRSVDAEGNVTFSGTPPANSRAVEEVSVRPGPSVAAQHEARERMQRQEAAASEIGKARADRAQQPAAAGAPQAADDAVDEDSRYYPAYPYRDPARRERVREAVRDRVQERPVQLPVRPVPR